MPAWTEDLNLETNLLSGTIPTELSQFTNLSKLSLGYGIEWWTLARKLRVLIVLSIVALYAQTEDLYLGDNALNGTVPRQLMLLTHLGK